MKAKYRKLAVKQLDARLQKLEVLRMFDIPVKGWVRAIRDALGMTSKQLGKRAGLTQARIARIEKDELSGKTTLKTIERIANVMQCRFVYAFIPEATLQEIIETQARKVAKKRVNYVTHTMRLEFQELPVKQQNEQIERIVDELLTQRPQDLWNIDKDVEI